MESLLLNSNSKVRLPLDSHSDIPALLDALRTHYSNTTATTAINDQGSTSTSPLSSSSIIEEVNVDIYESFQLSRGPDAATMEIIQLFVALASFLPNLQRLWVDSGVDEDSPFYSLDIQALVALLQHATQLQRLALYNVELNAASRDDMESLETAIRHHASLQTFGLVTCRLAEETIQNAAISSSRVTTTSSSSSSSSCHALDTLVGQSLAVAPHLQWVELQGQEMDALGQLSPTALGNLASLSTSLARLTLEHFSLLDSHICALARGLETSTTIRDLKITCEVGRLGCTAVAHLLFVNTSLNNFTMRWNHPEHSTPSNHDDDNNNTSNEYEIAAMHDNPNRNDKPQDDKNDDPSLLIAQALERNQTLQYFCLCGTAQISRVSQERFATLLRHNTTLLNCEIDLEHCPRLPEHLQLEVNMFLELNELGRKELFEGTDYHSTNDSSNGRLQNHQESTPQRWIEVIWHVRHNLDSIFYLLSMNPTLCDMSGVFAVSSSSTVATARRGPTYSGLSHLQYRYMTS